MKVFRLFSYLKKYRLKAITGAFFKLLEAVLELYMPLLLAGVIDRGVATGDRAYITKMCFILLGIVFTGLLCALVCQYLASRVSQGFGTELRNIMFGHIQSLSEKQTEELGASSLVNRMITDITRLQTFVAMLIRLVIRAPFLCIGGLIMAFILNQKLALVLLAVLPVFIVIMVLIMKKSVPLHNDVQKKLDKTSKVINENITGVRVIRAFSREEHEVDRFTEISEKHRDANYRVRKITVLLNPLTTLILNLSIVLILMISGFEIKTGGMITTGEIVAFINYVNQILMALIVVANLVVLFTKTYSSALRVIEVLDTEPDIICNGTKTLSDIQNESIEFKNVSFSYNGSVNAVEKLNLKIKYGQSVGIIGGTGSGKSTIVNLLAGFYRQTEGEIIIKGVRLGEVSPSALRDEISIVPQRTELFKDTVKNNIVMGREMCYDEMIKAARCACAYEFIMAKQGGFDSAVEKNGANFSGGQKQRLSIARALAKNSPVLILDDSSSALDYATDAAIRKNIGEIYNNITVITISQRVNSIKNCDVIYVVDDGKIEGCGTHGELYDSCSLYRNICASQEVER